MAGNNFEEVLRIVIQQEGDSEVAKLAKALLDAGNAGEVASEEIGKFGDELTKLADASKALRDFTSTKAALKETSDQLAAARAGLAALNQEFSGADTSSRAVSKAFAAAEKSVSDLAKREKELQVEFAKAQGTLQKAGLDTENLVSAESKLAEQTAAAAKNIKDLAQQANQGSRFSQLLTSAADAGAKGFQSLRNAVNSVGESLLKLTGIAGAVGSALGALSIGRLFSGAVQSSREFESTLSEVQAVSGATTEELQQLKDAAEAASQNTKFTAQEAAQALGELARATGTAQSAIAALPATLQLAQAAGYGVAESAQLITTTLTQFGLAATDAGRVADVLAKAANATTADVQGLGNALSYAAPLAKQLNLSFEQTTAVIGALADQGFRGERAGTALRNVFSQLLDPTSQFKQALLGLGIETNDFTSIIEGLSKSGDRGREALMQLDAQARPAILALVSSGGAAIKSLKTDLDNAAGSAAATAKVMGDNFQSAWQRFLNALDAARRAVTDPLLDPLKEQFDDLALRIRAFIQTADFDRIKTAISDFAISAFNSLKTLTTSIDFSALATSITDFAKSLTEWFKQVGESATSVSSTLSTVGDGISVFWNTLKTTVFAAAAVATAAFAGLLKAANIAAQGIAAMTGQAQTLKPVFDEVNVRVGALLAVVDEFGKHAQSSGDSATSAFSRLTASLSSAANASGKAAPSLKNLGAQTQLTADQADNLRAQYQLLPQWLQAVVAPSLQAAGVIEKLGESSAKASEQTEKVGNSLGAAKQKLAESISAYAELSRSGSATADELARAAAEITHASAQLNGLRSAAVSAAEGTTALKTAFATLGITSQNDLQNAAGNAEAAFSRIFAAYQSGAAGIEDVRAAFDQYAKAQLDSVANSDAWKRKSIEDMLEVKRSALGLGDIKLPDFTPPTGGLRDYRAELSAGVQASEAYTSATEERNAAVEASSAATEKSRATIAGFSYELQGWSQQAVKAFIDIQDAALQFLKEDTGGAGLREYLDAVNSGVQRLTAQVNAQQAAAAQLIETNNALTEREIENLARTAGGYDTLEARVRASASGFDLLDSQTLSTVQAATSALASKIDALKQKTDAALQSFKDYADNAQDQIDQINGDLADQENRRFQNDLEQLREKAAESNALDSASYAEAVRKANELHNIKLKQIRDEAEAKAKADAEAAASAKESAASSSSSTTTNTTSTTYNVSVPDVTVNGKSLATFSDADVIKLTAKIAGNPSALSPLLTAVVRALKSAAQTAGAASALR